MTQVNKGITLVVIGFLFYIVTITAHTSSLHNIDLSWNAKYINDLEDNNGIITQDILYMYQRSMLNLWVIPLFFMISNLIIFLGLLKLV